MRSTQTIQSAASAPLVAYSATELEEFGTIIQSKLATAREDLRAAMESLSYEGSNGTDDTYSSNKGSEEGNSSMEREELMMIAQRQQKFIKDLELAQERIRRGSYGTCRLSGARIPKERLRAVPHATTCITAKLGSVRTV